MQRSTSPPSLPPNLDHLQILGHQNVSSPYSAFLLPSLRDPTASQMANGKDFFQELRKQVTEKLQEREQEKTKATSPAKGG